MVWLACRKAWILSRLSFSASCTLVVNPPACHPLQAHLVLESHLPFRLILYWTRLPVVRNHVYHRRWRELSLFGLAFSALAVCVRDFQGGHQRESEKKAHRLFEVPA